MPPEILPALPVYKLLYPLLHPENAVLFFCIFPAAPARKEPQILPKKVQAQSFRQLLPRKMRPHFFLLLYQKPCLPPLLLFLHP